MHFLATLMVLIIVINLVVSLCRHWYTCIFHWHFTFCSSALLLVATTLFIIRYVIMLLLVYLLLIDTQPDSSSFQKIFASASLLVLNHAWVMFMSFRLHTYHHAYYILIPFSFSVFICTDRYAAAANFDRAGWWFGARFQQAENGIGWEELR
jgi:hypothetical protein